MFNSVAGLCVHCITEATTQPPFPKLCSQKMSPAPSEEGEGRIPQVRTTSLDKFCLFKNFIHMQFGAYSLFCMASFPQYNVFEIHSNNAFMCNSSSFLFWFFHSSVIRHLFFFPFLAYMNKAAMNMLV